MPTPARTSRDEIVSVGRRLIESEGLDGLTMQEVASVVGVRAPSLYKHVAGRGELIRLIIKDVVEELGRSLESATTGEDPRHDLVALAGAFRDFARQQPGSYQLIFAPVPNDWRPDPDPMVMASDPVLRTTSALVGADRALEAARMVTAWAHGFMTMELAGAFRLGGDIDRAFDYGIETMGRALSSG